MKNVILMSVLVMLTGSAFAEENWMMRFRALSVAPVVSDDINGVVGVSNESVPEIDFSYFFNDSFALELILATATHDVTLESATAPGTSLGTVSLLPPTLLAQYHVDFGIFKPYVGAGLNYTIFYGEQHSVNDVSYDNAMGYALQVGTDIKVAENLYINFDIKKLMLTTDVEVDTGAASTTEAEVELNPWIVGIGFGHRF